MPKHWEDGYKGPLPGNQLEFISPFARKGSDLTSTRPEDRVICYCNEAVGNAFEFALAPARMGAFGTNVETQNKNAGYTYSKRANKGALQYKFHLRPGTEIAVVYFHPETFQKVENMFIRKTVSLSFDSTVSVTEMKLWLAGAAYAKKGLMNDVFAIVTPSLKVHPLGSRGNENVNIPVTTEMQNKAIALGIREVTVNSG